MHLKTILSILLTVLALVRVYPNSSDDFHKVKIKLFTNEDLKITRVYITGNNDQLGNWKPDSIELIKENNYWESEFIFVHGEKIEFKFTLGSWQSEALTDEGKIPQNNILIVQNDTSLTYYVNNWKNPEKENRYEGQITGIIKYHTNLKYEDLLQRDIVVWLPPDYYSNLNKRYPVLYMHDGQNMFDPKTSFNNTDWQMDEASDSLIKNGTIDPLIIVGIYNTRDRSDEYSDTKKSDQYHQFIIKSVKPLIDSLYRTKTEREFTAVGGSSSGGLAAFLLAWNYPEYFSKAVCLSPAFKYENFDFTKKVQNYEGPKKELKLFIYNGGIGVDDYLQNGVDLMKNALIEQNYQEEKDLFIKINKSAEHNEAAWAKTVPYFLKLLYKKKVDTLLSIPTNNLKTERNINSKRFRLQLSAFTINDDNEFDDFSNLLLNINFRDSQINLSDINNDFNISLSTETGINFLFNTKLILPYAKIGPEIRYLKNIYADVHAGLGLLFGYNSAEYFTAAFPFWGWELGYIVQFSKNHSLELEFGINGIYLPAFLYNSISFTL